MLTILLDLNETNSKLVKPKRVDEEDNVKDEVAKDGHDHQWFPAYNNLSDFISICLLCMSVFEVLLTKDGHDCFLMSSCMHDIYRTPICLPINFCCHDHDHDDDDHHQSHHDFD